MSWFARNWDGVHLEGCAFYDPMDDQPAIPVGAFCTCPELMIEQAVGAAEMQRDAIKEHGL